MEVKRYAWPTYEPIPKLPGELYWDYCLREWIHTQDKIDARYNEQSERLAQLIADYPFLNKEPQP